MAPEHFLLPETGVIAATNFNAVVSGDSLVAPKDGKIGRLGIALQLRAISPDVGLRCAIFWAKGSLLRDPYLSTRPHCGQGGRCHPRKETAPWRASSHQSFQAY